MTFALQAGRVLLRDWRDSDYAPFAELNADTHARRFFSSVLTTEQSDAEADRIRAHVERTGFTFWALEIPGVTDFAGFVGLIHTGFEAHFTPCVEIGWRLLPAYWGKGFASEAAQLALQHAFEVLQLDEIVALTTYNNLPSMAVMQRIGMRRRVEDDFQHPKLSEGHPLRHHVLYRISRAHWQSLRQG